MSAAAAIPGAHTRSRRTAARPARPTEDAVISSSLLGLSSERSAEREQDGALPLSRREIERYAVLHPERTVGRQPAHATTNRIAQVPDVDAVGLQERVAHVEEHHAAQAERLHDRKDELVL